MDEDKHVLSAEADKRFLESIVPDKNRDLRACRRCYLIKTARQFDEAGCENCQDAFEKEDSLTTNFDGYVSVLEPSKSWVARYQGLTVEGGHEPVPGLYAVSIPESDKVGPVIG
eukprot:Clim_evm92s153 gene=Clim_evmTU92s153